MLSEEFRLKRSFIRRSAATGLLVVSAIACAPVVEYHGYFPDLTEVSSIKEGSHSQREIETMMGSPSTTASYGEEVWYYINSQHHTYAWKEPVVLSRQVIAIHFNEETKW